MLTILSVIYAQIMEQNKLSPIYNAVIHFKEMKKKKRKTCWAFKIAVTEQHEFSETS